MVRSLRYVAVGLVLALAGCGGAPAPAPAPPSSAPPSAPAVSDVLVLPWPAATPADAAALQQSVDAGTQPWLLDPDEVALSYVAATRGWAGAAVVPVAADGPDRTVDVRAGAAQVRLTLRQPDRTGPGGIWVVATETR